MSGLSPDRSHRSTKCVPARLAYGTNGKVNMFTNHDVNEEEDPELGQSGDDTDPEYRREMFRAMRQMKWKPEELLDKAFAAEYQEWLTTATDDD